MFQYFISTPSLLSLLQCGRGERCIVDSSVAQHVLWRKEDVGRWTLDNGGGEPAELTSLSQSLKAEMRVKTVGFFTSLQVREETKLVTP